MMRRKASPPTKFVSEICAVERIKSSLNTGILTASLTDLRISRLPPKK